jgi:hypothetical protein
VVNNASLHKNRKINISHDSKKNEVIIHSTSSVNIKFRKVKSNFFKLPNVTVKRKRKTMMQGKRTTKLEA